MFTFHSQQPTQGFARLVPPLMSEKRLPHWLRNSTQNGTGKRNFPAIRKLPAAKFSSVVKAIENLTFDEDLLVTPADENALDNQVL